MNWDAVALSAAVRMTFSTGEKPDRRLVGSCTAAQAAGFSAPSPAWPTGAGGDEQGRLAMEFYVNRGVLWQRGNSPVCSFIKTRW